MQETAKIKWVLLDDEGNVVRRLSYSTEFTVEVVEPKLTLDELFEQCGECLL